MGTGVYNTNLIIKAKQVFSLFNDGVTILKQPMNVPYVPAEVIVSAIIC